MGSQLEYLRLDKFPTVWCAGCGIGIIMGSIIRVVDKLKVNPDKVVIVSGIGCSGRMPGYLNFNTLHTTHGRALTFASGLKLANSSLEIIVVMGDGDAMAIGGNHLIHAARRNVNLTAIIVNNWIYGMTGGQYSPTTPQGAFASTAPYGNLEPPFEVPELARGSGASYVARGTVYHTTQLDRLIEGGMKKQGFALVEVISPCPVGFGRRNQMRSAVAMMRWQKNHAVSRKRASKMSEEELKDKIITGVFFEREAPEYTREYEKLINKAKEKGEIEGELKEIVEGERE